MKIENFGSSHGVVSVSCNAKLTVLSLMKIKVIVEPKLAYKLHYDTSNYDEIILITYLL